MKTYLVLLLFFISPVQCVQSEDDTLGKTHFIVGNTAAEKIENIRLPELPRMATVLTQKGASTCALFAPGDNLRDELIKLIDAEKEAIYTAVFMVTDRDIAQALVSAKRRGIDIQLIVDVGCLKDKASKIPLLSAHDCTIYLYDPTLSDARVGTSLMHHKFALFKNNKGVPAVWTGSYNFTKAASESNRENVIIMRKAKIYEQYLQQFEQLKKKSYRYERKTVIK